MKKCVELLVVNNFGVEGVDYINIYYYLDIELGCVLCVYGSYFFNYFEYGCFRIVYGFMCWLGNFN